MCRNYEKKGKLQLHVVGYEIRKIINVSGYTYIIYLQVHPLTITKTSREMGHYISNSFIKVDLTNTQDMYDNQ